MEFDQVKKEIVLQGGDEMEAACYALESYSQTHNNEQALSLAQAAAELDFAIQNPKEMRITGNDVTLLVKAAQNFATSSQTDFTRPTIEALRAIRQE